jgi:predicted membrane protein
MAHRRGKWLGSLLILFGIIFLLDSTGVIEIGDVWGTFWPLLLVLWGVAMLMRPGFRRRRDAAAADVAAGGAPVPASGAAAGSAGESINSSNVFGDVDVRVTSPQFRGGTASTVFGDISVDCHQGGLADGEHKLTISGVFGDARVTVPPGAALDVTAHTLAGDASVFDQKRSGISASLRYTTPGYESAPRRLRVVVSQVFGDVDVRQ